MHAMQTGRLTNLCLALSFILTVVSTGQKSLELLFTLTLGSYYRRTETLFQKRNTEHLDSTKKSNFKTLFLMTYVRSKQSQ